MFGFVRADDIDLTTVKSRLNSARYVGNYCNKGHFENPLVFEKKVLPTFRLMSKGLGSSFVDKHKERILTCSLGGNRLEDINDKLIYSINDFNYSLPRYYKDKILPAKSLLRYKVADSALKKSDALYSEKLSSLLSEMSENEAVSFMALQEADVNRQRAANIEERQNKIYKYSKI